MKNRTEEGKVWLVGAGPGDEGLLTLKGDRVLRQAQAVVYDALVGKAILAAIPVEAEVYYAGKRAGNHAMTQEEISRLLLKLAQQGKKVVRLHGGDPFLFGRGGEELELLAEHGIPFEVVPGVPSAIAVPAYCGIPATHRDFCSSLHILTGHQRKGEALHLDFQSLVRMGGTLVFLMGLASLPAIRDGLLEAGMPADMPAAVLSHGAGAQQKKVTATLSALQEKVEEAQIRTPAIIVVGEVCTLAEQFSWYEKLPLFGKRIVLTRPKERSRELAGRLRELGAEVLEVPAIDTVPCQDQSMLLKALQEISRYQWLVFTSPAGVKIFFEQMRQAGMDVRCLLPAKIAVLGEGTAKELEQHGMFAELMPEKYDGQELGRKLAGVLRQGERVLIPRASQGNPELIREIESACAAAEDIPLYDTNCVKSDWLDLPGLFGEEEGGETYAVFTSSSTVKGFAEAAAGLDFRLVRAVCIGQKTRESAQQYGMQTRMSEKATLDSLVECILQLPACSPAGK